MVSQEIDPSGVSPAELRTVEAGPPWWRRIGFWRAVAGMALAISLATVIVLVEFSALLRHRTLHYLGRVASLNETVKQLKRRVSSAELRNTRAKERDSGDEVLRRVVAASDLRTVKLADSESARKVDGANGPSGTLAISQGQEAAVLQVAGLTPSPAGNVYRVWWQEKRHADTLAAEFIPNPDGKATVPIQVPPRSASSIVITSEPGTEGTKPSGPVVLKGKIAVPPSR